MVVIGAGAAGIIAAWRAAACGAPVTLLEKNDRLGTKILISGGGKCNITHAGTIEELLSGFRPSEARFLRPACYRFTNANILELLAQRGLEVVTRPDGRVFPARGTARDVVGILGSLLHDAGVRVLLSCPVRGVERGPDGVFALRTEGPPLLTRRVVLCVGGSSYPGTGTTGDGWPWTAALGHRIEKIRPALAPIFLDPRPPAGWSGVALRDVVLRARQAGREIVRWRGDMLFTHRGVSGPTVLGISREVGERQAAGHVMLEVDILPGRTFEELGADLAGWAREHPRSRVVSWVETLVPHRFAEPLCAGAGVPMETTGAYLTHRHRNRLIEQLKAWPLGRAEHVPLEKGEVVAGGVSLDEIDPQTMRSRKCEGLYLAGEILDIAGPVGGYNLQAAFSTGFVSGETAAQDHGSLDSHEQAEVSSHHNSIALSRVAEGPAR